MKVCWFVTCAHKESVSNVITAGGIRQRQHGADVVGVMFAAPQDVAASPRERHEVPRHHPMTTLTDNLVALCGRGCVRTATECAWCATGKTCSSTASSRGRTRMSPRRPSSPGLRLNVQPSCEPRCPLLLTEMDFDTCDCVGTFQQQMLSQQHKRRHLLCVNECVMTGAKTAEVP